MNRCLARLAHDLGLAAWCGGAAMGAIGMNAATREVDDHTQRLRVADAGWFRWAPVVAVAVTTHVAGAVALSHLRWPVEARDRPLATMRALTTAGAIAATLETGRSGHKVMSAGDVPVATAVIPISDTPPDVARAQRRLRWAQWLVPALTAGIIAVHACEQDRTRRRGKLDTLALRLKGINQLLR